MDLAQAREFGREHHRAVLATRTATGQLRQSPVLVTVDADGCFVVSTREGAYKARNVRADPWVQLVILDDGFFGPWIWVEGTAQVVSLPEAMGPLVEYYRSISGEHENWDDYRAAMTGENRVVLRINATAAGPDRQG